MVGTVIHAAMEEILRGRRGGLTEGDRQDIDALVGILPKCA